MKSLLSFLRSPLARNNRDFCFSSSFKKLSSTILCFCRSLAWQKRKWSIGWNCLTSRLSTHLFALSVWQDELFLSKHIMHSWTTVANQRWPFDLRWVDFSYVYMLFISFYFEINLTFIHMNTIQISALFIEIVA